MIGAVPALLALAFLVTALLYASVGFGGGSTYSALLALSGLDYRLLPLVSLACNIVVVTGGSKGSFSSAILALPPHNRNCWATPTTASPSPTATLGA